MIRKEHKEWRGHSYALNLRGGPRNWNPCQHIRMLHAKSVLHSIIVLTGNAKSRPFPLLLRSNYSKRDFLGHLG